MTTFIGRKFWGIVKEPDEPLKVIEIKSIESRSKIIRKLEEHYEVKMLLSKKSIERFQGMSAFQYVRKYSGKDGYTMALWDTIQRINVNG